MQIRTRELKRARDAECERTRGHVPRRQRRKLHSEEDLPHVFDRFYRADKARSGDAGGFGLGLAIAREVAREHGGNITASSTPDEVTAFRVTIPLTTEG